MIRASVLRSTSLRSSRKKAAGRLPAATGYQPVLPGGSHLVLKYCLTNANDEIPS
ncbi:MAG: hypothetical protein H0X40_11090 [Chthoniobacterales bacterium]|nr:hypothetical protein [Chthoniobacterales bacterium]